jgi:hypothetical protein
LVEKRTGTVPSRRDWPEYACPDGGPSSHTGGNPQAPPASQKFKIIIIIIMNIYYRTRVRKKSKI